MSIAWAIILLAAGLAILWKSADLLVDGAVALAKRLGVSPLVIGLTVVAMGTSAPEVAASIAAVARGMADTAVGNVYGSNIANLALVGGLAALIRPIKIEKQTLQREMPVMLAVGFLLWPFLHDLFLSAAEAIILLAVFAVFILLTVYTARTNENKSTHAHRHKAVAETFGTKKSVLFVIIGLAGLAIGADITVRGAVVIGRHMGLSDAVIGLTIIAVGTSLPELATCIRAAIKAQHEISIGNLVGSNIFNTLLVVGTAGAIWPFTISPNLMKVDYWVMILISGAFTAIAVITRRTISRPAGALLLCGYATFIVYRLI
jgi:cation:H+ antiporter